MYTALCCEKCLLRFILRSPCLIVQRMSPTLFEDFGLDLRSRTIWYGPGALILYGPGPLMIWKNFLSQMLQDHIWNAHAPGAIQIWSWSIWLDNFFLEIINGPGLSYNINAPEPYNIYGPGPYGPGPYWTISWGQNRQKASPTQCYHIFLLLPSSMEKNWRVSQLLQLPSLL